MVSHTGSSSVLLGPLPKPSGGDVAPPLLPGGAYAPPAGPPTLLTGTDGSAVNSWRGWGKGRQAEVGARDIGAQAAGRREDRRRQRCNRGSRGTGGLGDRWSGNPGCNCSPPCPTQSTLRPSQRPRRALTRSTSSLRAPPIGRKVPMAPGCCRLPQAAVLALEREGMGTSGRSSRAERPSALIRARMQCRCLQGSCS